MITRRKTLGGLAGALASSAIPWSMRPAPTGPDELAEFTRSELEVRGRAIRMAGIEPE